MIEDFELTTEQQAVLSPTTRVVEAGPGSGKTRSLVARFIQVSQSGHQGVALLSFTNAAVDEVRRRTRGSSALLQSPNFVGTIDSFLHRFVVTPAETSRLGATPMYLASWGDLAEPEIRVWGVDAKSSGISLGRFLMNERGRIQLSPGLNAEDTRYVEAVRAAGRLQDLLTLAAKRIGGLNKRGIYDSNTARVRAWQLLQGEGGDAIVARIARRFGEILVDEAQDCDEAEMAIIRRLARETSTIVVADPDQAIFEFRGGKPGLFTKYRDEHPEEAVVDLVTNHRSTPEICAVVSSLRHAGRGQIKAANAESGPDIVVLKGSPTEQGAEFRALLRQLGLEPSDGMVMAHSRTAARAVVGQPADGRTASKTNRLVMACTVLRRPESTAAERLEAVKRVERIILSLLAWQPGEADRSITDRLEILGKRPDWLRLVAGRLVLAVAEAETPDAFVRAARGNLSKTLVDLPRPADRLGNKLVKPDEKYIELLTAPPIDAEALTIDTIHGRKGTEHAAVLLALPARGPWDGLDAWEQGIDAEARRVLYVAASRAEVLLAIGAGRQAKRVTTHLRNQGIKFEVR